MSGARLGFEPRLRLHTRADFQRVFADPLRSGDRHILVLGRVNEQGHARLGLAISRKCSRSAVVRNRIKRGVREWFRLNQHSLPALDLVVIGRVGLPDLTTGEVRAALERHARRLQRCLSASSAFTSGA